MEVVGVFANDEVGDEVEGGEPSKEWGGSCGGEDGCLVWFASVADFGTFDNLSNAVGGLVVEEFGNFVSDDFVVSWVGFVFRRIFGALFDRQAVEAFDSAVVFSLGLFSFCGGGLLRCGWFAVGGGFG